MGHIQRRADTGALTHWDGDLQDYVAAVPRTSAPLAILWRGRVRGDRKELGTTAWGQGSVRIWEQKC